MVKAVTPIPFVRARFFDRCGKPLAGGKVYSYAANTTTEKVTYKDPYGLTPNTNPIILDAAGEADIYLDGTYRIRITDRNDVLVNDVAKIGSWFSDNLQDTLDNISGAMDDALKPILQNLDEAINTAAAAGAGANGWVASLVKDASGLTQQQVNYNGGSKWHSRVGGYLKNERVVLANGDIVKSTIDGNTNNPNVDMTGWVNPFEQLSQLLFPSITMERLGGSTSDSGSKNVLALREYFRGAAVGEYGSLMLGRGTYNLNEQVVSTSPVSIVGVGTSIINTGVFSAFADTRTSGDTALIKFSKGSDPVISLNLEGFEVDGRGRISSGIEFNIDGWCTRVDNVTVRNFNKNGVIFQKTNDGLFTDLRILACGSNVGGVPYYALDMNPTLTTSIGGSNQLNFVRLHIEVTRYFMRMHNWLCNFYGAHFEFGGASHIINSQDWKTPLFDVGSVSYQNNFYGCNFVYPSIYLLYRANNKVGGADFFNTCAPIFGSTLSNISMLNPVATNVMNFDGCSFIPNGGTGTDKDNTYMHGYKLFNLPFAQVKLSNCSAERLISNNYGGNIVASRTVTLNNNIIHAHVVTQTVIDSDTVNATLLNNYSTVPLTKFIHVISNDAAYSSVIGNKFYSFDATQLVDDLSTNTVYSKTDFVVSDNSGITNKFTLPNFVNIRKQEFKNSNLLFQLDFSSSVAKQMLADTTQGTFYVTKTTSNQNKIQRFISVENDGIYEQNLGGHYIYPVTSGKGGLGLSTNVFKEVHVQDLAVYPPASNSPTTNGEMTFELTSNTQLTVKVKGSDGIVRSAVLTLA